jgi:hypothetical protein
LQKDREEKEENERGETKGDNERNKERVYSLPILIALLLRRNHTKFSKLRHEETPNSDLEKKCEAKNRKTQSSSPYYPHSQVETSRSN